MAKTKDLFLNMVANPDMTLEDLASVGLTSENTMLLDRALYASNEKVQDMFKDSEGNFDEQKFNTWYDLAEQSYNILANDEVNLSLMNVTAYDSDNIFVDPSKRKVKNEPIAVKLPNPDRLNIGIHRIGKIGPRTLSQDEIAQTQQVLLNPTEVANGAEPIYGSSPNDSWFEDFWDTRVMAAWDEDGTHIDPVTGKETLHKKGDLKLNENGTYYYESLDGRSVYGKRILNKFNTLTTDGSAWNKYDFFDSDSIELKSIGGSIAKNLALVGSMFIPYVGWGVAAASVAHQSAGLFATLGKMLAGSDSPTLDAIEGWVKSTDRRNLKTEYAQQNTWCWENFIDLIGDTTAQLREQRAIFKFAPGIIKGDFKALSEKAMKEYGEQLAKEGLENATSLSFKDLYKLAVKKGNGDPRAVWESMMAGAKNTFSQQAQKAVRLYLDDYYKLGEPIAKAYMTAITVLDTFGEAILAGATDGEATLLTLGYAAAEAALLSTDLGKWIMPELRTNRLRSKMIAKKLFELPEETRNLSRQLTKLNGETKKDWAKRLFNVGRDIARAEYSMMPTTIGTIAAQGLGEGVEEVSEEALADFSKSCFNLVQQLQGDDVRMHAWNHNWDWLEAANRYGMSFVGGIFGGGINAAASDYKANREILNMDSKQAMLQLIYMARNNELDDFWKTVNKTTLASKELSTQLNDNGIGYKPGTKEDNQDLAAKKALKKQIDMINSILNAENAKLDDDGLLTALLKADPTLQDLDPVKEYRMHALSNSATAGRFLNEWNTIDSDIVKNQIEQQKILAKYGDKSSEKMDKADEDLLKDYGKKLKVLQQRKDAMLDGTRTREYVRDALFEMTYPVKEIFDDWATLIRYSESATGKKFSDISEEQKAKLKELYEKVKGSNQYAEKVHLLADIYETMATTASQGIQASADYYEKIKNDSYQNIVGLNQVVKSRLNRLIKYTNDKDKGIVDIQRVLGHNYVDSLISLFSDDEAFVLGLLQEEDNINQEIAAIRGNKTDDLLTSLELADIANIENYKGERLKEYTIKALFEPVNKLADEFIQLGFAHPETKYALETMFKDLKNSSDLFLKKYDVSMDSNDWDLADLFDSFIEPFGAKLEEIKKLSNTPILENLKQFQLSTDTDRTVLDLITYLHKKETTEKKDIAAFTLETTTKKQFEDARKLLEMYRSAISGARFDNVDIDNIVGFNTTLNELSGANEGVKLAEIDGQTADLILEDINVLLKRLDFAEGLHNLNKGNKYNMQSKTALNKNYILFNKIKSFVSILEGEDEWKDQNGQTSLQELLGALNNAKTLIKYSGFEKPYDSRTFAITPDEKDDVESELIDLQVALHKFFKDRIDGSDASIDKLSKVLTYDNFKGLIRENNEFLDSESVDIDDSAFIWWLCATAALDPTQFNVNYNAIVGQERTGERPIAPIPTQELGVFALTAAITNGDMFRTFGKALRQSLNKTWDEKAPNERKDISDLYGGKGVLHSDSRKPFFKSNDFLPNFENIVFIEGIAGSGKSTGVLKTLSRVLVNSNPDFANTKMIFAHTDSTKAQTLGESTDFKNFEAHDHDSLLKYMSSDYNPPTIENDVAIYEMDKDVKLVEGILRSPWKINQYNPDEVPKIIFIDEWSHYNQIELDLIQRFALLYGVTVITMGDYDLLTPKAKIRFKDGTPELEVTPSRNMAPRVAKLGVSMRTDNDLKTGNIYRMLAWRKNPTDSVQLHYYEDENGIYGDKLYVASSVYDKATLDKIKLDVLKMISTLKDGEKIGYIYHKLDSELYKWLTEDPDISQHVIPYQEKDAHGREAQYYIVENNREGNQDALDYFESAYTGITRSEQGSLIITNSSAIRDSNSTSPFNEKGLSFTSVLDTEMLPDTFTDEGTRNFTRQRKRALDKKYLGQPVTPFDIKPRTRETVIIDLGLTDPSLTATPNNPNLNNPNPGPTPGDSPSPDEGNPPPLTEADAGLPPLPQDFDYDAWDRMNNPKNPTLPVANPNGSTTSTEGGLPPLPPEGATVQTPPALGPGALPQNAEPSFEEFGGTVIPDGFDRSELFAEGDETWQGPLPKGLKLYKPDGSLAAIIVGEHDDFYSLYYPTDDRTEDELKDVTEELYFLSVPEHRPVFKVGMKIKNNNTGEISTINGIELCLYNDVVYWGYAIEEDDDVVLLEPGVLLGFASGELVFLDPQESEILPDNEYETEGAREWLEVADSQFSQREPSAIETTVNNDIYFNPVGFTFNNFYLADNFDDNGNIVITNRDILRIDNGYGLHKLNPNRYRNKAEIENDLGIIRRHLLFSSNDKILSTIQKLSGKGNLDIRWGFVSKAPGNHDGIFERYNQPLTSPIYMTDEDNGYLVSKTLSAIIYLDNVPILELPIITLQSPHSIFLQMAERGEGLDVLSLWKFGKKAEKETLECLTNIINHIRTNRKNSPGYQNLANYLKLWLFTSNGFQTLFAGKDKVWNLHEQCKNYGNLYITHKLSDNGEFDYAGTWVDLTSLERKDRFISSIMINKTDTFTDPATNQSISIFRKYTPYVLISDDPDINTDEAAAEQYLRLLTNPLEEARVKAVPVVPPEMSVEFYINAMKKVFEGDTNQPYGNKYSPYRIWSAILNPELNREPFNYNGTQYQSRAAFIMSLLDATTRAEVIKYVKQLKDIEARPENLIQPNESKIAHKRRLANALNLVLNNENDSPKVYAKLRSALVDCCKYNAVGDNNTLKDDILAEIAAMAKESNITGILCKPKLVKDLAGLAVGGFAYKVETEDKFKFPGHGSYRIFGKIDTPAYSLGSLWWNFRRMSYNAKPYKEYMEDGQLVKIDGVWSFNGFDELIYLEKIVPKEDKPKLDLTNVRSYYKNLLARLGMHEYNMDESKLENYRTESEAYKEVINTISKEYVKQNPSAFYIWDNTAKLVRYGKLGDAIPEYANLRFISYQANPDGTYSLKFNNNETGNVEILTIQVQPDNSFQIRPPKPVNNQSNQGSNNLNVAEIKERVSNNFADSFLNGQQELINRLLECYNVENNTIDIVAITSLLLNSGLDEWSLEGFRNTLEFTSIVLAQTNQSQEEQNQDVCVNPIKISFK